MSGKIVGEVGRYAPKDLTPRERFVLVALAESVRDTGPNPRRSRTNTQEIAEFTGYSVGSVRNALVELRRRCLIYPVHAKACKGVAQDYQIVHLEAHHRAATTRHREAPNASSGDDAIDGGMRHSQMTHKPVDNSESDNPMRHREAPNASSGDDAHRKDSTVTTVSSNSSRQVTVQPDTDESGPCETNGAPNSTDSSIGSAPPSPIGPQQPQLPTSHEQSRGLAATTVANGLPPSLRSVGLDQHPAEPSQWPRAGPPSEPPSPATRIPA